MKSKIEKLNIFADELSGKDYVKVLGIANKVDEIIDWINSQDQEEWEKEFELPDEIEYEDCIEVLADKHKLWEICSWEEPELDPDKVVAFIKQLLEERECRAREEGTFTKEELEGIGELLGFMESDYPSSYWKPVYDKIKLKLTTK